MENSSRYYPVCHVNCLGQLHNDFVATRCIRGRLQEINQGKAIKQQQSPLPLDQQVGSRATETTSQYQHHKEVQSVAVGAMQHSDGNLHQQQITRSAGENADTGKTQASFYQHDFELARATDDENEARSCKESFNATDKEVDGAYTEAGLKHDSKKSAVFDHLLQEFSSSQILTPSSRMFGATGNSNGGRRVLSSTVAGHEVGMYARARKQELITRDPDTEVQSTLRSFKKGSIEGDFGLRKSKDDGHREMSTPGSFTPAFLNTVKRAVSSCKIPTQLALPPQPPTCTPFLASPTLKSSTDIHENQAIFTSNCASIMDSRLSVAELSVAGKAESAESASLMHHAYRTARFYPSGRRSRRSIFSSCAYVTTRAGHH